jgi:hypothetical protein
MKQEGSTMTEASVTYQTIFAPNYSVTGVRQDAGAEGFVIITGSYSTPDNKQPQALLYRGPIYPTNSSGYIYLKPSFPNQTVTTSVFYGPNTSLYDPSIGAGNVRAVGSYKYSEDGGIVDHGMMYQGSPGGGGTWTQINMPDSVAGVKVAFTIPHSTMGDLVVGNYDSYEPGKANGFIFNVKTKAYKKIPVGNFLTAYGIWQNGGSSSSSYTITGGLKEGGDLDVGYLVDYDVALDTFSHLTYFQYNNKPGILTHFEGITLYGNGYSMAAESDEGAAFATIPRNSNGTFGTAQWVPVKYPATQGISTGNTVLGNNLFGIYQPGTGIQSYVAAVQL